VATTALKFFNVSKFSSLCCLCVCVCQVKSMWVLELELGCDASDIKGLIDGYGTFCEKLSDITLHRKG